MLLEGRTAHHAAPPIADANLVDLLVHSKIHVARLRCSLSSSPG
jgi:hypothetical protein